MSSPVTFTVGGVPEHFNLPWHLALQKGAFEKQSLHIRWKEYPGGTGAMTKDLRSGALDVAVLLTEGIVSDICLGNPSRIIAPYVVSPLIWGIHVLAASEFGAVEELEGKRFAISRYGSGSHLMAFVHARQRGWDPKALQLVLIGDLNGARESFRKAESDAFMWEKAMTQPLVDRGEFRRVGECPTPWPCFVIAARREVIDSQPEALGRMLEVIRQESQAFKNSLDVVSLVGERYGIQPTDVSAWLAHTHWADGEGLSSDLLQHVMQTLLELDIIPQPVAVKDLYQPL
jgi:ABC-type nitrate/sulfonate/bicarbonate transport system substrate-binding protein